jgi:hypothetical protein
VPSFPRTLGLVVVGVAATTVLTGCGSGLITRDLTRVPQVSSSPSSTPSTPPEPVQQPAPPSPEPVVIPAGVAAYGDSVMLGATKELTARGVTVDAIESRQFHSGVSIIRNAAAQGTLPRNVVVHLGTNGSLAVKDCRAIVDAAGPDRRVFFVTTHAPRSWIARDNANLVACDADFPGRQVVLIDWHRPASKHSAWFYSDGIHLNGKGRAAYAAVVAAMLGRFQITG